MKTLGILVIGATSIFAAAFVQAQSTPGTTQPAPTGAAAPAASAQPARQQRQQQRQNQSRRRFQQPDASVQQPQPRVRQRPQPAPLNQPQPQQGANTGQSQVRRQHQHGGQRNESHRPTVNFTGAVQQQHRERHDRPWWHNHFTTIVFVHDCGYYYWDAGYWFPAFGYYPQYENFDYNGPIYTYGNLLPDQVIYNVQSALKELGYYSGPLSGSMSAGTRAAISAFQEDNGLDVTGAIDAPTVETLGLY